MKQHSAIIVRTKRAQFALAYAGYFLTGITCTFLGPLLFALSARWQLNDAQAGSLFTAQAIGVIPASALSGWVAQRFGQKTTLALAFGLQGLAIGLLSRFSWEAGLASLFINGFGIGLIIPTTSVLIAELAHERRASALNVLNVFWGVGAFATPSLSARLIHATSLTTTLTILAAILFIFAVTLYFATPNVAVAAKDIGVKLLLPPKPFVAIALIYGCLAFIYVGAESSVGGWVATLEQRLAGPTPQSWSLAATLFWAGLLGGRALSPLVLRRVNEVSLILLGSAFTICGQLLLQISGTAALIGIGAGLAGLGFAPIYPTLTALFTEKTGPAAGKLTGILILCGGLGAAVFPGLTGWLAGRTGQLRVALIAPLLACAMIPFLLFLAQRQEN